DPSAWSQIAPALSRHAQAGALRRPGHRQEADVSDQSSDAGCAVDRALVSETMEDRVAVQVDEATPAHQGVLRHDAQRRQDATVDRRDGVRPDSSVEAPPRAASDA